MDLIEEIPLWKTKRRVCFRIKSPIMETFFYLNDKHSLDERDVRFKEVEDNLARMINLQVERFAANTFAELFRYTVAHFKQPVDKLMREILTVESLL